MLHLLSRDVCRLWTWRRIRVPRQWVWTCLNKVLLGWVAMNDDISQIQILICYHQSSAHRSSWTERNGKLEPPWNAVKCNMVQVKHWDSECKQSSSFAFFLQGEVENTPGNVEVAAAQARAVALNKVSASISQSWIQSRGKRIWVEHLAEFHHCRCHRNKMWAWRHWCTWPQAQT